MAACVAAGAELSALSATSHLSLPIGMLGLFPLFVAIRVFGPLAATATGLSWGLLLFARLASWGMVEPTVAVATVFGAAPAIHAALGVSLTRWIGYSPLAISVLWFGVELAHAAVGLPKGLFAGAPQHAPILAGIANGLGIVFIGFGAAYVAAVLVSAISTVGLGSSRYIRYCTSTSALKTFLPELGLVLHLFSRPPQPRAPPV